MEPTRCADSLGSDVLPCVFPRHTIRVLETVSSKRIIPDTPAPSPILAAPSATAHALTCLTRPIASPESPL